MDALAVCEAPPAGEVLESLLTILHRPDCMDFAGRGMQKDQQLCQGEVGLAVETIHHFPRFLDEYAEQGNDGIQQTTGLRHLPGHGP